MTPEPQISLHAISCDCEQCLWFKVRKCWAQWDSAYEIGKLLGIKTCKVRGNSLDIQQKQEAWFARLAQMRKGQHAS